MRTVVGSIFVVAAGFCQAAAIVTTVDSAGDVGSYSSVQLDGGKPVVSYYDTSHGDLKLARCTDGCTTAAPTWIVSTVDAAADVGWYTSLQLDEGKPVIAYRDARNGSLKLATCVGACDTASPQWAITVVDASSADTGRFASLQLNAHKPLIAYRDKASHSLKLATCTANCQSGSPTWLITVVDSDGDVGRFASMKLDAGRPVIGYFDFASGRVKVATCVAACDTASPGWVIHVVDTVPAPDDEMQFSLALDGSRPWLSYYARGAELATGSLKLATCTGACDSAEASWSVAIVDAIGDAGQYSSVALHGGKPVVAYHGALFSITHAQEGTRFSTQLAEDLRIATCTDACATPQAAWVVSTADNSGLAGWDPHIQVDGNAAFVSYYDILQGDLKVAYVDLAQAAQPVNHTGLWWNFQESGWGINFSHQGDIVFATLFTYDSAGAPMWLVMPAGTKQSNGAFTGALYRTTGPAFDANPFTPITAANLTAVGTMTLAFAGDTAALSYDIGTAAVAKTVRQQVFGASAASCHPATADRSALSNHQDLWWNPSESGWGVNVTQQGDVLFATLFTYDRDGKGVWLVMSSGARQADGSFAGDLYRTTASAFNAVPFVPITAANVTKVGTMRFEFSSGVAGTLTYSFDGRTVVKAIERQVFSAPAAACSG